MGKHFDKPSRRDNSNRHQGLDKHNVSDGPSGPERGGLHGIGLGSRKWAERDASCGNEKSIASGGRNDLSQHNDNIQHLHNERIGISGSTPGKVRRSFDPGDINPLLNDPEIFDTVALSGLDHLDAAALLKDERNVLLIAEGGAILFIWNGQGVYEIMEVWRPAFRVIYARDGLLSALCWMFTHTDCSRVLSKVPCVERIASDPLIIQTGNAILQVMDDQTCKVIQAR